MRLVTYFTDDSRYATKSADGRVSPQSNPTESTKKQYFSQGRINMIYMEVDVHKSYLEIATVDDEGNLNSRNRVRNTPGSLDEMVQFCAQASRWP